MHIKNISLLFISIFFNLSFGQNINHKLSQNIEINGNYNRLIDSTFLIKDGEKSIENVYDYSFNDKKVLKLIIHFFKDNSPQNNFIYECDNNGNVVRLLIKNNFDQIIEDNFRELDTYGNVIKFVTNKKDKQYIFTYDYKYDSKKRIIEEVSKSKGSIYTTKNFLYDKSSNLVEEKVVNSLSSARYFYKYIGNKKVEFKQIINNLQTDKFNYIYKNGLLIKEIHFDNQSQTPSEKIFEYNSQKKLILEKNNNSSTKYLNFDNNGNWRIKETYYSDNLSSITSRSIF